MPDGKGYIVLTFKSHDAAETFGANMTDPAMAEIDVFREMGLEEVALARAVSFLTVKAVDLT